jgi:hypothetical protein
MARRSSRTTALLLDREVDVFSRYLLSEAPTKYVRDQYCMAVAARGLAKDDNLSAFDRATLNLARRHALFTRFADAYCSIFHRHGVLRRKLVLLVAILEHTASSAGQFDKPKIRRPLSIGVNLLVQSAISGLSLVAGTLLLLPAALLSRKQTSPDCQGRHR